MKKTNLHKTVMDYFFSQKVSRISNFPKLHHRILQHSIIFNFQLFPSPENSPHQRQIQSYVFPNPYEPCPFLGPHFSSLHQTSATAAYSDALKQEKSLH